MHNQQIELLQLLQQDCRMPLEKLAVMLGQPMETVGAMIDDLEKRGIILRYSPVINWDKTERERVEAMIEVRVTPQRGEGFDAIAKRIYRFDEVKTVYLMSGAYDLLLLVEAHSLKDLGYFVSTKLSVLDTVTGTATHFVLNRYTRDGVIFEGDAQDKRLAVNP
jgi:DNA-binding Lrp family transcriptional regulator